MYRFAVLLALGWLLVQAVVGVVVAEPLRDPTQPLGGALVVEKSELTSLKLMATRVDENQSSAVINGHRAGVGGQIGTAQVMAIGLGWVRLQRDGREFELRLQPVMDRTPRGGER